MYHARYREPQAVELRYDGQKEWTCEGERTRGNPASVAIDGYCTRKNAERMLVRKKADFLSQFGWHRGSNIVPKCEFFRVSGFYLSNRKRRTDYGKRNPL